MTERVTDILLERYLADDLSGEQRARVESALETSADAQRRLAELSDLRDSFFATEAPEAFAHRLAVQLAVEQPSLRWKRWLLGPTVAVALGGAAVGVIAVQSTDEAPELASAFDAEKAPAEPSMVAPEAEPAPPPSGSSSAPVAGAELEEEQRAQAPPREDNKRRVRKRAVSGSRGGASRDFGSAEGAPAPAPAPAPRRAPAAPAREEAPASAPAPAPAKPRRSEQAQGRAKTAAPPESVSSLADELGGAKGDRFGEFRSGGAADALEPDAPESIREDDQADFEEAAEFELADRAPAKKEAKQKARAAGPADVTLGAGVRVVAVKPKGSAPLGSPITLELRGVGYFAVATRYRDSTGTIRSFLEPPRRIDGATQRPRFKMAGDRFEVLVLTSSEAFSTEPFAPWTRYRPLRNVPAGVQQSRYVFTAPAPSGEAR